MGVARGDGWMARRTRRSDTRAEPWEGAREAAVAVREIGEYKQKRAEGRKRRRQGVGDELKHPVPG